MSPPSYRLIYFKTRSVTPRRYGDRSFVFSYTRHHHLHRLGYLLRFYCSGVLPGHRRWRHQWCSCRPAGPWWWALRSSSYYPTKQRHNQRTEKWRFQDKSSFHQTEPIPSKNWIDNKKSYKVCFKASKMPGSISLTIMSFITVIRRCAALLNWRPIAILPPSLSDPDEILSVSPSSLARPSPISGSCPSA